MTISSTSNKAQFNGSGTTGPFAFTFKVFDQGDLTVIKTDTTTLAETTLTITTDYTVSLNADQNNNPGGSVTTIAAVASGYKLTVLREVDALQETDITNGGGFYPEVIENALDRVTMLAQQNAEAIERAALVPIGSTYVPADLTDDLITLAAIEADISAVAAVDSSVTTVAGIAANVTTVAGIAANVTTVAGISVDVSTVAADSTDIGTVATNIANVNAVAGISGNVTTVAGISANVTSVAGNSANINTVAGISSDVTTVAGISSSVQSVASQSVGWLFDSSTTMADPGAGDMRFNNATPASVTAIAVSDTDTNSADVSAFVVTWDDSTNTNKGTLTIRKGGSTAFAIYTVTGLTDNVGWTQLSVTYVTGTGTFSAADKLFVSFQRAGDKGVDGLGAGDFSSNTSTSVDGEIVLFSGTGGKTGKRATTTGMLKASSGVIDSAVAGTDYLAPSAIGSTVQAYNTTLAGIAAGTTQMGGFRNKIIGGDFTTNPWQRGTSFTGLTSNAYAADRWTTRGSASVSGAAWSILKTADAPTAVEAGVYTQHCLHLDVTTSHVAGTGAFFNITQPVEGYNAASFGFGQAGTRYITLSFWHKHTKTGTYCISFQNSGATRSYVAEYTQAVTDTWEKATITIAVDTTGTWLYDNGIGLYVNFTIAAGSTVQTTANTWAAGNYFATANQVNALDSTSNNFKIALVQLEAGSVATPFETRSVGQELALCQRYYQTTGKGAAGGCHSTTQIAVGGSFPVQMRDIPNLSLTTTSPVIGEIGTSVRTGSGSTISTYNSAQTASGWIGLIGGFTGLTATRPAILDGNYVIAEKEL